MNKIKAVIFDMDGVIFDTEPLHDEFAENYSRQLGAINIPVGYFKQFRGSDSKSIWSKVIKDHNLSHIVDQVVTDSRVSYEDFLRLKTNLKPITGIKILIKELKKRNLKIAVATSAGPKRAAMLLKIEELDTLFDLIVSADHVTKGKPAPDIYLETAKLLKVYPRDCIVIEDAEKGIIAAKSAGMKVIGFAGLPHNEEDLSRANKIIYSFKELTSDIIHSL